MPWRTSDAPRFNKKTKRSKHARKIWADAANNALKEYGSEASAVRVANAAVQNYMGKGVMKKPKEPERSKEAKDAPLRATINGMSSSVGHHGVPLQVTRPILRMN